MVTAYILIEVEPGKVRELVPQIVTFSEVKSACAVTGPYDVISYIEAESIDILGELVTNRIQTLDGVRKTMTCLCTYCSSKE